MKRSVTNLNAKNIVDFIGSIFEKRGDEEYLGEPVTMGQHMLQGATMAEQSREPDEIIIGTLLHDIGHFTSEMANVVKKGAYYNFIRFSTLFGHSCPLQHMLTHCYRFTQVLFIPAFFKY